MFFVYEGKKLKPIQITQRAQNTQMYLVQRSPWEMESSVFVLLRHICEGLIRCSGGVR